MEQHRQELLTRLQQKREWFLQIEEIVDNMLLMDVEELEAAVKQRGNLLEQIAQQDEVIREICQHDTQAREMLNHTRLPNDEEERQLYDASLNVKAVANQIIQAEPEVERYMKKKQQELLDKIQNLNISGQASARRYRQIISASLGGEPKNFSRNF